MTIDDHAQLSLRRTGGLAGLPMIASLDTRDLARHEAETITSALDRVDLARVGQGPPAAPGAADMLHFDLEVRRGDHTHVLRFGERQMPAELAPVVRALMDRAEPAPGKPAAKDEP